MNDTTSSKTDLATQKMTGRHIGFALACICMEMFCVATWFNCAGIFYKPASAEFEVGLGSIGIYITISFFVTAIVLPPGGRLLEKRSARAIYVVTNILMAAGFLLNAAAPNVYVMYIAGCLGGAMGAFDMYLLPVIIRRWFKKGTGTVVGVCLAMSGVGAAIFNIVGAAVIGAAGWRMGYVLFGILVAVVCIPMAAIFIRSYPQEVGLKPFGASLNEDARNEEASGTVMVKVSGADFEKVRKTPAFVLMIIMAMCGGLVAMMSAYLPAYATSLGYTAIIGATMASAAAIGNMVTKVVDGPIADKSTTAAVLSGVLCPAVAFIGLMLVGASNPGLMIAFAFLYGGAQPNNTLILPLCVQNIFGEKDYNKIWSWISPFSSVACGIGASVWGFIFDATGNFTIVFTVGIILMAIRAVCYFIALPSAKKVEHTESLIEVKAEN